MTLTLASPFVVRSFLQDLPKTCSMKTLTGVGCPGCGLTRSVCALSEGRWIDSVRFHAFGVVFYGLAAASWVYFLAAGIRGRELFRVESRHWAALWLGALGVMLIYWGIRLTVGAVP